MDLVFSSAELGATVKQFWERYGKYRIFALSGEMGAGKTTFISMLAHHLGVMDAVSSPTYSIINHYRTVAGADLYHFDLYRISGVEEAIDLGIEDILQQGAICFIEWPEIIATILPSDTLWMEIIPVNETQRTLKVIEPR